MERPFLARTLSYTDSAGESVKLRDVDLLTQIAPLIILGEPGMGKTALMRRLGTGDEVCFVTARKLLREIDPRQFVGSARILIIDALDEVSAANEGDAVDAVLRQLSYAGRPRFVLSCRVADWRSATAAAGIEEDYGAKPIESHLEPFDRETAEAFLCHSLTAERANDVISHFAKLGPIDLLGNPQTLIMLEAVAQNGDLPGTRGALYERAVAELRREHRAEKAATPLAKLDEATALDAVGAAFATLIILGKEAISVAPSGTVAEGDVHVGDISSLPGGAAIEALLGSRLFRGTSEGRFFPLHRTVAEYLGARWLAHKADTPRKRRRLLALIVRSKLVPANLRGIHAWLARDPQLAPSVIAADPLGVILYGDADRLSVAEGKMLLLALEHLDDRNPGFRSDWGTHSMQGMVRAELVDDLRRVLISETAGYGLRSLILDALDRSPVAGALSGEIGSILLNPKRSFGLRHRACEALAHADGALVDWSAILTALNAANDNDSARLAVNLLSIAGFEHFSDEQIAETVFTYGAKSERSHAIGRMSAFERELPDERIDRVLDFLSARASQAREDKEEGHDSDDVTDVIMTLVDKRLKIGKIEPLCLWGWLEPLDGHRGHHRPPRKEVSDWFEMQRDVRQAIQRHVLLDTPGNRTIHQRAWPMYRAMPGLSPSPADVVFLLGEIGTLKAPTVAEVDRWKGVVLLARHGPDSGEEVRQEARKFCLYHKGLNQFIDGLAKPRIPAWQIKEAQRRNKAERKRKAAFAGHRRSYGAHIEEIRSGLYGRILAPAQAYLGQFSDIEHEDGHIARLDFWLGEDVRNAAIEGFEAFLTGGNGPTSTEIAESHAKSKCWHAEWIIIAAMAERWRTGIGFADLSDERLHAGLLSLQLNHIASAAKLEGLELSLVAALRERQGAWERYWRHLIEPQLKANCGHVDGLYQIMRSDQDADLSAILAAEWLNSFPELGDAAEIEMMDRLSASHAFDQLRLIGGRRKAAGWRDDTQRRNWEAVEFLINFPATSDLLAGIGARDRSMIWFLRHRTGNEHGGRVVRQQLSSQQVSWVIYEFRLVWPHASRPNRVTSGDRNDWNASDWIEGLISQLGEDTSDAAIAELASLRDAPADGYTQHIQIVASEQAQKRVEREYQAPSFLTLHAILADAPPSTAADLQAALLEELRVLQGKLDGHPLDWRKGFFDEAGQPRDEEACRDEILKMIGEYPLGILSVPEGHLAADKRADIQCTIGQLMLPIEIKGQWHKTVWTAAATQLDRLYAADWRADRRGIYIVLWFGQSVIPGKLPKLPPCGVHPPATATDLAARLRETLPEALLGQIEIVVLDLTDPGTR